jgi:hypothetical protein
MEASPIFVKTYAFLKWLLPHTVGFPKAQRFLMAKRIEDAALTFHERIVRAGCGGGSAGDLKETDIEMTKLRVYLRLAMEMQLLSFGQYEHAARMVDEIGRLLGGWVKRSGGKTPRRPSAGGLLPA